LAGDDVQIMERTQVGVQAQGDEWMYIGRGMHRESLSDDGVTRGRTTDENHLRGMWSHYSALMAQN
jgi:fatty-acyl-CoA synthase